MEFLGLLWDEAVTKPMTNGLMLLYFLLFSNLGLAIITFTLLVRGATYPLVMRQLRQTRKMQELQPRMRELQERYKDDPQKRGQEVMRLYREMGVSPVGCLGPLVIQMPIFIGLFWAINNVLPFTPENLAGLAERLYGWLPMLDGVVPVERSFLGMDLAIEPARDRTPLGLSLVALSGVTMYVQQKMTQVRSADPTQQSTQRMMLFMFPVMFGMFSLFFPGGLVVYWVVSNLVGITIQTFVTGRRSLIAAIPFVGREELPEPPPARGAIAPPPKEDGDGAPEHREDGEDGGRGDRPGSHGTRRRPRRNRRRRR
ncbi:MAG: YidC/Oxa1 family membrane protein insertase [Chloroflexota bacterium]|nr:YidC/Oxa1 family membrane protein insertase [Chloroflexota bacterium]